MGAFFLKDLDAEPSEPGVQSAHDDETPVADLESLGLATPFLYGHTSWAAIVVLWSFADGHTSSSTHTRGLLALP